ncbi:MAG: hypothetical protein U0821_10140 [Chloroflexota bacterium]
MDQPFQIVNETPSTGLPGVSRPTFGMARDQGRRIEVTLVLDESGTLTVLDEAAESVSAESLDAYAAKLSEDIAAKATRSFADAWGSTGQRAWVSLGKVVAFSVRPAR